MAQPTPSSEIIHLVSTFADTLDSLPPTITRNLSDLKELDAVLSGSLQTITSKLQRLLTMMHTPPAGTMPDPAAPTFTPYDRLKLLREVTEDARAFRLGGEDKIRVASTTCESIATHNAHLSTLSSLLLTFLPAHLVPHLPPPSAPHGYPSSLNPSTSIARRQVFDYPPSQHPGAGSTARMVGALGMVRQHWDVLNSNAPPSGAGARSGAAGGGKRRAPTALQAAMNGGTGMGQQHDERELGAHSHRERMHASGGVKDVGNGKEKDPSQRHPNQYTKKKLQDQQAAAARTTGGGGGGGMGGAQGDLGSALGAFGGQAAGIYGAIPSSHALGMSSLDGVGNGGKDKRRSHEVGGGGGAAVRAGGSGSGSGSASGYSGMASLEEYNAATAGGGRSTKRKGDDSSLGGKRRKTKAPDASPDPPFRSVPTPPLSTSTSSTSLKPSRRTAGSSSRLDEQLSQQQTQHAASLLAVPDLAPGGAEDDLRIDMEGELDGIEDDDGDGQTYCVCHRISFGEMIGCDGTECDREWFHLSCVGLEAIPKGRWFCDECRVSPEILPCSLPLFQRKLTSILARRPAPLHAEKVSREIQEEEMITPITAKQSFIGSVSL